MHATYRDSQAVPRFLPATARRHPLKNLDADLQQSRLHLVIRKAFHMVDATPLPACQRQGIGITERAGVVGSAPIFTFVIRVRGLFLAAEEDRWFH